MPDGQAIVEVHEPGGATKVVEVGIPNAPGAPGRPGLDGKSAYQIAVDNGFSGTQAEWLASLSAGGGGGGGGDVGGLHDPFPNGYRGGERLVVVVPNITDGHTYTLENPDQASLLNIETGDYMSIQPVAKGLYDVQAQIILHSWNTQVGRVVNLWVYSPFGDVVTVAGDPLTVQTQQDVGEYQQSVRSLGLWPFLRSSDVIYPEMASLTDYQDYSAYHLGTVGLRIILRPVLVL